MMKMVRRKNKVNAISMRTYSLFFLLKQTTHSTEMKSHSFFINYFYNKKSLIFFYFF